MLIQKYDLMAFKVRGRWEFFPPLLYIINIKYRRGISKNICNKKNVRFTFISK